MRYLQLALLLALAGCAAPEAAGGVQYSPPPPPKVLTPLEGVQGVVASHDLSQDIAGKPATLADDGQDRRLWMIVAVCEGGGKWHQVEVGVLPYRLLTGEILDNAQAGAYTKHLPCGWLD